jgi:hypothetical protein
MKKWSGSEDIKITKIPCFQFEDGVRVEFLPVKERPGFSHKVVVLSAERAVLAIDWFGIIALYHQLLAPNSQDALFYYEKYIKAILASEGG